MTEPEQNQLVSTSRRLWPLGLALAAAAVVIVILVLAIV